MVSQPAYAASKEQIQKRLSRIEGQVRGVGRMVEEERYCIDVLNQIQAIEAALDKVALGLLDQHARSCVANATDHPEKVAEMMEAVGRFMRR